jgi:predicted transcriptional regulator
MPGLTVRINDSAHATLRALSKRRRQPMQAILAQAIEEYRRKTLLEDANRAYAALRKNPKAWREEEKERRAWDATLADGLSDL